MTMTARTALLLVAPAGALLALGWTPASTADTRPHLNAARTDRAPVIDGLLDEASWQRASASDAFVQKFPHEGQGPVERTWLRVLYDDEAIYVGLECEQRQAAVTPRLTRRDRAVEADWLSVAPDTLHKNKSGFQFTVNAAGVLGDSLRFDDTEVAPEWDENWEAATAVTERGWSAELRIPLRILRFATLPVQSWGLQVRRHVSQRQEIDEWAFIPRSSAGEVSRYGRLDDLRGLRPGHSLEVSPFLATRLSRGPGGAPPGRLGLGSAAGLDLKGHPSQEITLDVSVRPDFGQVEADPVILNLTNYEIDYPEQRRFFLEGTGTFAGGYAQLLYTRRIGRVPPAPALPDDERAIDAVGPTTIQAAGKLTGRLGERWELGLLSALTGPNRIATARADGSTQDRLVEPRSLFDVLRLRRSFGENGHLGLLATSLLRLEASDRFPHAHAGAVDGRWRSPSGDYVVTGQLIGSRLDAGPPRLLPDGGSIRAGELGGGVNAALAKEGGEHWLWDAWVSARSRKLEINDVGYLDRANLMVVGGSIRFRTLRPWWATIGAETRLEARASNTLDGLPLGRRSTLATSLELPSFWEIEGGLTGFATSYDDREVGDGAALERSGGIEGSIKLASDGRRGLSGRCELAFTRSRRGASWRGEVSLTWHALPQLELALNPQVLVTDGEPRYVETTGGVYLFGRLRADSWGAFLRAAYTFTPRLTVETYVQLLVAARHYDQLSSFTPGPGARPVVRLAELQPGAFPSRNPDSKEGAANANLVLRWEWRPGAVAYLAYSHAQAPRPALAPGERGSLDLAAVARGPAVDVLMLKLSYWWG